MESKNNLRLVEESSQGEPSVLIFIVVAVFPVGDRFCNPGDHLVETIRECLLLFANSFISKWIKVLRDSVDRTVLNKTCSGLQHSEAASRSVGT